MPSLMRSLRLMVIILVVLAGAVLCASWAL